MDPTKLLNDIRIASPCRAAWADMSGDERVRFCRFCNKHVFNISALSAVEAAGLIERTQGRLCARLYRRRDGTVLTSDCAVGAHEAARNRLRRLATWALMGVAALLAGRLLRSYGEAAGIDALGSPTGWLGKLFARPSLPNGGEVLLGDICPIPPANTPQ
jgi:hypothetical protein